MKELLKMTAHQIKEGKFDKVILAIGSCEAHGQHLAEGCDTIVSYELSKQVADRVPGMLVLPPITVGYSGHYDTFPFTLTFDYETMIHVIYDIVESVLRNGINKIFLMNGHDGNIAPIEIAARKIKEKYPDARIASLPDWWVGLGHAGEGESSIAYHLFPQWCEPDQATCVVPDHLPEHVDIKWDFAEITDTAQTGDATIATAEKGKLMNDCLVDAVVKDIEELEKTGWNYNTSHCATKLK